MVTSEEFQFITHLLKTRSGIALSTEKEYLIENRLLPIARSKSLHDVSELCQKLRNSPSEELVSEVVEAMTTNESSFFRDIKPYEQFRNVILPMLMQSAEHRKKIRIWSAACSTGQEPYTISMCIREDAAKMPGWHFDIVATDLARKVIDKAKAGIYSQFEAQRGLPIQMLIKYFTPLPDTTWQLKQDVRAMVDFKTKNLLEDYTPLGQFDLIFCRNVLIYFDDETKMKIIEKMAKSLSANGLLILGSTESLIDSRGLFAVFEELRGAYKLK